MKEPLGINWEVATPYAFVGNTKWNLKPAGITMATIEKLIDINAEFGKKAHDKINEKDFWKLKNDAAKKILTLTLEKFNFTKSANDPTVGPGNLFMLAGEVKDFLRDGGAPARRLLQMRLNTGMTRYQNTTRTSKS